MRKWSVPYAYLTAGADSFVNEPSTAATESKLLRVAWNPAARLHPGRLGRRREGRMEGGGEGLF